MGITWLALLIFVGLLGSAGAAIVVAARSGPRTRPEEGGVCAACGYSARGLASFTCPECGADLREVGIVAAERPGTARFLLAAGLWLGSITLLGTLMGGMLLAVLSLSPGGAPAHTAWAVTATLLLVTLTCVVGVVWMGRRTKASGAALTGTLLVWGFFAAALALAGVLARV